MHFSGVLSFAAAIFVAGAVAQPHAGGPPSIEQSKTQCPGGKVTCCINKSDIQGDGVLDNLLSRGLLTDVLGASDQACAHTDLIGEINLLGTLISTQIISLFKTNVKRLHLWQGREHQLQRRHLLLPQLRRRKYFSIFNIQYYQANNLVNSLATLSKSIHLGSGAKWLAY